MKRTRLIPTLLLPLLLLTACGQESSDFDPADYEHPAYVSAIEQADCCLCGDRTDHILSDYWGQDNMGLVNVNTFEVFPLPINTYGPDGLQIKEAQGVAISGGMALGELRVTAFTDPDRGSSHVDIPAGGGTVDPEAIGAFLCQDCLDAFAEHIFVRDTPSEIAVVNFSTRELRPLIESCTGFGLGNFSLHCDFEEDGGIRVLIYYAQPRFAEIT